jgi:hypothetical protein
VPGRLPLPRRSVPLLALFLGLLLVPAPGPDPTAAAAAPAGCRTDSVPLRLLSGSASSLLTTVPARGTSASAPAGFADRGVVALATTTAAPGTVPVARYRSGRDYVYVTDTASRRAAEAAGYRADGETFRGSATPAPGCTQAVYQLGRGASHQVAVGGAAVAALARQGWQVQRLLFHAADVPGRVRPGADGPVARALPANDKDTTFGMVVLPDLQREVHTDADQRLLLRSRYIAGKQKSWDLRLAVSVGDITDWDTPDHAQYARAAQQLEPVVAAMPFVATPGNHDSAAVCPGGSACLGLKARTGLRDTSVYNAYFPASRFSLLRGEFEPGKVDNAYHTFRAGGVDWLVLNLELWPRREVVDWAEGVVKANPRKNVVIVTHSYLTKKGKVYGEAGGYGSTSPRLLQDRVVKRYPNVKIVLSGHTGKDAMRTDKGAKGNKVVSYLQCFHSTTGNPFRRLTINTRTGRIDSQIVTPSAGTKKTTKRVTGMKFVKPAAS